MPTPLFKKGVTLNPYGRPRREDVIGDQLRDLLRSGKTALEIATRLVSIAKDGEPQVAVKAIGLIADRVGGKAVQAVEHAFDNPDADALREVSTKELTKLLQNAHKDN